jgi:hypothetical protein
LDRIRISGLGFDELEKIEPLSLSKVLAAIGRDFEKKLGDFDDRPSVRRKIIKALLNDHRFDFLQGVSDLYFVFFQRLSPFETDFIKALARNIRVRLNLSFPEWLGDVNERVRAGFLRQRLLLDVEGSSLDNLSMEPYADVANLSLDIPGLKGGPLVLREERVPKALIYASKHLFGPDPKKWREKQKILDPKEKYPPDLDDPEDPGGSDPLTRDAITIVEAPNIYMETEAAARIIKKLIVSGAQPHSLGLVVPDLRGFLPQIEDVGRRFGLSFHHRRGVPLEMTGPVKAFYELFYLFGSLFERKRVVRLLLSPYFDFGLDRVPVLELIEAGVIDDRAGSGFDSERVLKDAVDNDLSGVLNLVRRLRAIGDSLEAAPSWEDFFATLDSSLDEFSWPNLKNNAPPPPRGRDARALPEERFLKIQGDLLEVRKRDLAAEAAFRRQYDGLKEAFLENPLAPKEPSLGEFDHWLSDAVSGAYVRNPGVDNPMGKVRLLNYYDLHGAFFDALFLLGLNEDAFPKGSSEGAFWPKKFVESFNRTSLKRSLWHNPLERYHEEEEIIQGALNQTKKAYLFYSLKDDFNKPKNPSHFISSLMALWPDGELKPKTMASLGLLSPPRGDLTAEENELRLYLLSLQDSMRDEIIKKLDLKLPNLIPREMSRPRAKENTFSPEVMEAFVNSLGKYPRSDDKGKAKDKTGPILDLGFFRDYDFCPRYFWHKRILRISLFPTESEEIRAYEMGTIFHDVLQKFLEPLVGKIRNKIPNDLVSRQKLEEVFQSVSDGFKENNSIGREEVFEKSLNNLKFSLLSWLERQNNFENVNIFDLEWSFGDKDDDAPPLMINSSRGAFYLKGRIDRIDKLDDGIYLIKDYKLSHKDKYKINEDKLDSSVYPILAYCMAVRQNMDDLKDVASEFEFLRSIDDKPFFYQNKNLAGAIEKMKKLFSTIYENVLSGNIKPLSKSNCENCDYSGICDYEDEEDD